MDFAFRNVMAATSESVLLKLRYPAAVVVVTCASTQKPAAHCCGGVLAETIHFATSAMPDRTGQAKLGLFIHSQLSPCGLRLGKPVPTVRVRSCGSYEGETRLVTQADSER
jgi:hypothetical protein